MAQCRGKFFFFNTNEIYSRQSCLKTDKLKEKSEPFDPFSEGVRWFCYVMGAFYWAGLDSLVHWDKMIILNQCRVVLRDHLWSMMEYFSPDRSGLFKVDNAPIHRVLNGMKRMMWFICFDLQSHHIATQLNTSGRFWTIVSDSTL